MSEEKTLLRSIGVQAEAFNKKHLDFEIIYEDYIQGAVDEATECVAAVVEQDKEDSNKYSVTFEYNDEAQADKVRELLSSLDPVAEHDFKEIERAEAELSDLKIARRNARNLQEFKSFDPSIEKVQTWLDEEGFSRADLIQHSIKNAIAYLDHLDINNYNRQASRKIIISLYEFTKEE